MDRRTFLKAVGAGIAGSELWPFTMIGQPALTFEQFTKKTLDVKVRRLNLPRGCYNENYPPPGFTLSGLFLNPAVKKSLKICGLCVLAG